VFAFIPLMFKYLSNKVRIVTIKIKVNPHPHPHPHRHSASCARQPSAPLDMMDDDDVVILLPHGTL
jgi:hypothetical protein